MSKTILITGGAASGKTRWAVSYLAACDNVLYLCAAKAVDRETLNRIDFATRKNFVEWEIKENITDAPASLMPNYRFVIFDSLASYVSDIIRSKCPDISDLTVELKRQIISKIISDVTEMYDSITAIDGTMIVVTLEPGFSVTPETPEQMVFREILGAVNQRIANMSNEVYMSASGIQFKIK